MSLRRPHLEFGRPRRADDEAKRATGNEREAVRKGVSMQLATDALARQLLVVVRAEPGLLKGLNEDKAAVKLALSSVSSYMLCRCE